MQTNIYLVPCPFPLASGSGCFPGFGLGITLKDRQQEALLSWLGVWGPGTWHNTSCNLLTVCILPPMPQNHRTFLYLSVDSIAHLPPSLSAVYPLYFSLFFSLSSNVSLIPLHSIFPLLFRLFAYAPPPLSPHHIHHYSSHLHLVCSFLLSTCFHFLNCSRSIIFTLPSMTIFHFLTFIHSYVMLSRFTWLLSSQLSQVGLISPSLQGLSLSVLLTGWKQWGTMTQCVVPTQWDNQVSLCKQLGFSHDDLGWK